MSRGKVLFIDSVHEVLNDRLESMGFQCDWLVDHSREEILSVASEYVGIVIRSKFPVDREFLERARALKFIARSGSGLENIDLSVAEQKQVRVFNSPEGNRDAVGEQVLGMLLALFQNLVRADIEVRQGLWRREENRGVELKGKTFGIIGYGQMGSAVAERLRGFGCEVLAYDKHKSNYESDQVSEVSLEVLQAKSDIISFHVPLKEDTLWYLNDGFLGACKAGVVIINTSRGKVVRTHDLVMGLKSGIVGGACLDVLEYESSAFEGDFGDNPHPDFEYLTASTNVILSPHIAGWTKESYLKLSSVLADKIEAALPDLF
jgi:D-3-phosphoglycerate dehydrogenase